MKTTIKEKVRQSVQKTISERLVDQLEIRNKYYAGLYDGIKEFEFKAMDDCNMTKHFCIDKNLPQVGRNALAVYIVLCSLSDFQEANWVQVSVKNLSKLSGLSAATVIKAIKELEADGCLLQKLHTEGKRHFKQYLVYFIRQHQIVENKGNYFRFYTHIVDSGLWAHLAPAQKAIYLILRANATPSNDVFHDPSGEQIDIECDAFLNRPCDGITDLDKRKLACLVNIRPQDVNKHIKGLERDGLVSNFYHDFLEINLRYQKPYDADEI